MTMRCWLLAAVVVAGPGAAPPPVGPTATPQLSIFGDRFYRGDAKVFTADEGDIRLGYAPRSVKAVGRWLVCSEVRFGGRCMEINRDYPVDAGLGMAFNIRSLRLLADGSGAGRPAPNVAPDGPSMGGMSAKFFPAPHYGAERALACVNGDPDMKCAAETATDLCKRAGYRSAEHFALQAERGLYYLADVLCVRR
ncbi:hypothetical protein [Sandarakinorhabdus glacialis]|nr:hypothetical protein [Polymorphobacter glacialis]